jgi:hypothetical protein
MQEVQTESSQNVNGGPYLLDRSHFPSPGPNGKPGDIAEKLFGTASRMRRAARKRLNIPLWLTSLHRPGVFELLPTENVSNSGVQMVSPEPWEPDEQVLLSSPPGFLVQGSVAYCRKLPSENHILGIRFHAPMEDWIRMLGPERS